MYINTTTLVQVSEAEIRSLNPNTSFGIPFVPPSTYVYIFPTPQPTVTVNQIAREIAPVLTGLGHWEQRWEVINKFTTYVDENDVVHTRADQEAAAALTAFKATVPTAVTMRQARLALLGANVLATADAAIAAMPGIEGAAARIEWEYAHEIRRDALLVSAMSSLLGLTEATLDQLFITANTL